MATLLNPDGTKTEITPANGRTFTVEEIYTHLDCKIVQVVRLPDGRAMWIDEHGKFQDDPHPNLKATCLLHKAGGMPWEAVMGRALICTHKESGEEEAGA